MDAFTRAICELSKLTCALFMVIYVIVAFTTRELFFFLQSTVIAFVAYSSTVVHNTYFRSMLPGPCDTPGEHSFFSSETCNLAAYGCIAAIMFTYCSLWKSWPSMVAQKLLVLGYLIGISVATVVLHNDPAWLWLSYLAYGILVGAISMVIIRYHVVPKIPPHKLWLLAAHMGLHDTYIFYNCPLPTSSEVLVQ